MANSPQLLSTPDFYEKHVLYQNGADMTYMQNQAIGTMQKRINILRDSVILINSFDEYNQLGDDMMEIMRPSGLAPPTTVDNGITRHDYKVLVRLGQGINSTALITTRVRLGFHNGKINHLEEDGF